MGPPDSPPLELDESQLFGEEEEEAPLDMSCSGGTAARDLLRAAAAAPTDSDASASDDDGIVLESECSSSGARARTWQASPGPRRPAPRLPAVLPPRHPRRRNRRRRRGIGARAAE